MDGPGDLPVEQAIESVKAALAEQGFGIITEIDIAATLKEKIGAVVPPQVILGACNPNFAHQALQSDPSVGLLLPCNVVVRADADRTIVEAIDPLGIMPEGSGLAEVADQVQARLQAALDAVE